ncbi:MAG: carboxypeptidase regulatory-like domain-containing protein [Acidobacteria bacterium]|nr:carboxypeptidase regulatory-like domain-containing protein [Acidobacteriota bacterium]
MSCCKKLPTLATLLLLAISAPAQEVTAGVYGVVMDASGAVVPNATVRLRNAGTGRAYQTVSDESGNYSVVLLPMGIYEPKSGSWGGRSGMK